MKEEGRQGKKKRFPSNSIIHDIICERPVSSRVLDMRKRISMYLFPPFCSFIPYHHHLLSSLSLSSLSLLHSEVIERKTSSSLLLFLGLVLNSWSFSREFEEIHSRLCLPPSLLSSLLGFGLNLSPLFSPSSLFLFFLYLCNLSSFFLE